MRIDYTWPDGRQFHFEKQPMDKSSFSTVCGIIYALIGAGAFVAFITALCG